MKLLAAVALVLSCCAYATSECVEVTGLETKPSGQNVQITVLLNSKPQGNVKLTVTLPEGQGTRSFVTDSHGTIILKDLPVGKSCLTADGGDYFRADLCLVVSEQSVSKISSFTLNLFDQLPPAPALSNVQAAEKNAMPERLRKLDGAVLDPAGGVVLHAEIQVFKSGSYPRNPVAKVWTDQKGRFAVTLSPDSYVVVIRMPGFRNAVRVFEISPDGREGELHEVLQLGGC